MKRIDEMWKIFNDIEIPTGKLCIPITGGLDSRVLAGVVRQHRDIDYSFYFWSEKTRMNTEYVETIANRCRVKHLKLIKLDNVYNTDDAVDEVINIFPKNEYIFGCHFYGGTITGMMKTDKQERDYFLNESLAEEEYIQSFWADKFKEVWRPWWNARLVGYMLALPRRDRIFQRLYIEMIKKYLPDLASIPRCFESVSGVKTPGTPTRIDRGLLYYTFRRFIDKKVKR